MMTLFCPAPQPSPPRFSDSAGIAIGPILFVIAILALLASVIASNMGTMSNTGTVDRITADIPSQANLIRTKINECETKYGTDRNLDGYPASAAGGTDVSQLTCVGDMIGLGSSANVNLWSGPRPTNLPPPTQGFNTWTYVNTNSIGLGGTASGGRCIYTTPSLSSPSTNPGIIDGLTRAANKFTHQATCDNSSTPCTTDVLYNSAAASQKFVMWITVPTGTPDSHCLP